MARIPILFTLSAETAGLIRRYKGNSAGKFIDFLVRKYHREYEKSEPFEQENEQLLREKVSKLTQIIEKQAKTIKNLEAIYGITYETVGQNQGKTASGNPETPK